MSDIITNVVIVSAGILLGIATLPYWWPDRYWPLNLAFWLVGLPLGFIAAVLVLGGLREIFSIIGHSP